MRHRRSVPPRRRPHPVPMARLVRRAQKRQPELCESGRVGERRTESAVRQRPALALLASSTASASCSGALNVRAHSVARPLCCWPATDSRSLKGAVPVFRSSESKASRKLAYSRRSRGPPPPAVVGPATPASGLSPPASPRSPRRRRSCRRHRHRCGAARGARNRSGGDRRWRCCLCPRGWGWRDNVAPHDPTRRRRRRPPPLPPPPLRRAAPREPR